MGWGRDKAQAAGWGCGREWSVSVWVMQKKEEKPTAGWSQWEAAGFCHVPSGNVLERHGHHLQVGFEEPVRRCWSCVQMSIPRGVHGLLWKKSDELIGINECRICGTCMDSFSYNSLVNLYWLRQAARWNSSCAAEVAASGETSSLAVSVSM